MRDRVRAPIRPVGGHEVSSMTDEEFMAAVRAGDEPGGHVANLRLTWLLLRDRPDDVEDELAAALATRAGRTGGTVHQTRTAAWLALVRVAMAAVPTACELEDLLRQRPELLDRNLLHRYYEPLTLADPMASVIVVVPDRAPLPGWPVPVAG